MTDAANTTTNRCEGELCNKDTDCLLNICLNITDSSNENKSCSAIEYRLKLEGYLLYYEIGSWSVAGILIICIVGIIIGQKYRQGKEKKVEEDQKEENTNLKDQ